MSRCQAASLSIALAAFFAFLPAHAGQRAFVSSAGNDANVAGGCNLAAPCRTFQAAHTAVDVGGEIVALDTAGYAPVIVSKSVTILGNPGAVASIAVASGHGVTIATAGVSVVLRNLNINGLGPGTNGVHMSNGASLSIENCVIARMGDNGVNVATPAKVRIVGLVARDNGNMGALIGAGASAEIVHSEFTGNDIGVLVNVGSATTTRAAISDSVASGGSYGFAATTFAVGGTSRMTVTRSTAAHNAVAGFHAQGIAEGTAHLTIGNSMATGNNVGFSANAGGGTATFESLGNNIVRQNTIETTAGITTIGGV